MWGPKFHVVGRDLTLAIRDFQGLMLRQADCVGRDLTLTALDCQDMVLRQRGNLF